MVPPVSRPLPGSPRLALLALLTATSLALAACGGSSTAPPAPTATSAGPAVTASSATQATTQAAAPTAVPPTAASATSTPTPAPTATTAASGSSGSVSSSDLAELEAAANAFKAANSYRETIVSNGTATPGTTSQVVLEYIRPDRYHYKITGVSGISEEIYVIGQTTYVKTGGTWIKTTLPGTPTVPLASADPKSALAATAQDKVVRQGTETVDGVQCRVWLITNPTNASFQMWIGVSDHLVRKLVVTQANGTRVTVTITNYDGGFSINPPI